MLYADNHIINIYNTLMKNGIKVHFYLNLTD